MFFVRITLPGQDFKLKGAILQNESRWGVERTLPKTQGMQVNHSTQTGTQQCPQFIVGQYARSVGITADETCKSLDINNGGQKPLLNFVLVAMHGMVQNTFGFVTQGSTG